jgi:microcystin-dependent protein
MSSPFIGEIRLFGGNFAPQGWVFCDGQTLPISFYEALFNLIGTTYGGDGQESFNVPDLRGRVPLHQGVGPGLSPRSIGEFSGTETVTLNSQQLPSHSHPPLGNTVSSKASPANSVWSADGGGNVAAYSTLAPTVAMSASAIALTGGSQPHNNMQPFVTINYIMAVEGIFPQFS